MANTSVRRAVKFSVDRLGYESLKPEHEIVLEFLVPRMFLQLCLQTTANHYACLPYTFDSF